MTSRGFLGSVLVSLALVGGAAACGVDKGDETVAASATTTERSTTTVDGGSGDETTTTEPSSDTTADGGDETTTTDGSSDTTFTVPGEIDVKAAMVDALKSAGFTEQQASCLADEFEKMGLTESGSVPDDPTAYLEVFDKCGISLADLGKLGGAGG